MTSIFDSWLSVSALSSAFCFSASVSFSRIWRTRFFASSARS
jgi:hypothetical protein